MSRRSAARAPKRRDRDTRDSTLRTLLARPGGRALIAASIAQRRQRRAELGVDRAPRMHGPWIRRARPVRPRPGDRPLLAAQALRARALRRIFASGTATPLRGARVRRRARRGRRAPGPPPARDGLRAAPAQPLAPQDQRAGIRQTRAPPGPDRGAGANTGGPGDGAGAAKNGKGFFSRSAAEHAVNVVKHASKGLGHAQDALCHQGQSGGINIRLNHPE
jgi:hypothetical protein